MTDDETVTEDEGREWPAIPVYRWPNLTRDLDYRPLTRRDLIELDQLVTEEGLVPTKLWSVPAERVLSVASAWVGAEDLEPVRDALRAIEDETLMLRGRMAGMGDQDVDPVVGGLRMRLLSHAWHRLRERCVELDGQTWVDFDYWWKDLRFEGAGSCVYNQFVSSLELANFTISWIARGLDWASAMVIRQDMGQTVSRTNLNPRKLERRFKNFAQVWQDIDLRLPEGSSESILFTVREAACHTLESTHMIEWSRRFDYGNKKDVRAMATVYGDVGDVGYVKGLERLMRENEMGKKCVWRINHKLMMGLLQMHGELVAEDHALSV